MHRVLPRQQNLQATLIGVLMLLSSALGDWFEECTGVPDFTFVASATSCASFIYCNGTSSYNGECFDGTYFNEINQTCDPTETVDCRLDSTTAATTRVSTASTLSTATATVPTPILFTSSPASTVSTTRSTVSTLSTATATVPTSIVIVSTPVSTVSTTASTTRVSTVSTLSTATGGSTTPPVSSVGPTSVTTLPPIDSSSLAATVSAMCPEVDNPYKLVFVRHSKSCSDYFICYRGEATPMRCSAMLHFDVESGKCDYPQKAKCQVEATAKEQCQAHTVDEYPHPSNCNYFYRCTKGYLVLRHCPFSFGWDYEKRACVKLNQAKCFSNKLIINN